ncbi:hypothetical protein ACUNGC_03120, partial [Serratia sp. IR-2025]|jgi:hypothetical protein
MRVDNLQYYIDIKKLTMMPLKIRINLVNTAHSSREKSSEQSAPASSYGNLLHHPGLASTA